MNFGTLFVVATPIGNLKDISPRAVSVLENVDLIASEDTRHSKKLLSKYNIKTRQIAYHEYNEEKVVDDLVAKLLKGVSIALISDAGTPLISDPGYYLVTKAKKVNIEVVPIPGPSALITALSSSGLASNSFTFFGFLPSKPVARLKLLQTKINLDETIIFYESPKRILSTLEDMFEIFGGSRDVCLAKELTKSFETILTDKLPNLIEYLVEDISHQKGEFVILVSPADKIDTIESERQLDKILPILCAEMGASKAAKLAAKITGIDKKHCYKRATSL